MPPIWTRRASRAGSFGVGFGLGLGFGFGGTGGGVGVVPVPAVVEVVSVVVVVSVSADSGSEPARTDAARKPAKARLERMTAAPTLRTREV